MSDAFDRQMPTVYSHFPGRPPRARNQCQIGFAYESGEFVEQPLRRAVVIPLVRNLHGRLTILGVVAIELISPKLRRLESHIDAERFGNCRYSRALTGRVVGTECHTS